MTGGYNEKDYRFDDGSRNAFDSCWMPLQQTTPPRLAMPAHRRPARPPTARLQATQAPRLWRARRSPISCRWRLPTFSRCGPSTRRKPRWASVWSIRRSSATVRIPIGRTRFPSALPAAMMACCSAAAVRTTLTHS